MVDACNDGLLRWFLRSAAESRFLDELAIIG